MNSSKRQSIIAIAIACIVVAALLVFYGLTRPKVNETALTDLQSSFSSSTLENFSSDKNETSAINSGKSAQTTVPNTEPTKASSAQNTSYPVNLNTCTYDDLISIDGIGDAKAQAILEYRDYLGGYTDVSQLKDIRGIGEATFAKIEPYVTV